MLHVCEKNKYLDILLTGLRDTESSRSEFRRYAELLGDYLVSQCVAIGLIPFVDRDIETPTGNTVKGKVLCENKTVAVPIVRAGNAFMNSVFRILSHSIPMAQLVIQRDESTAQANVLLGKFPKNMHSFETVIVLDPMLGTGGSVIAAINVLLGMGVLVDHIVLVHALAAPEGLAALRAAFPSIKGVVGVVDSHLNECKFIVPGLGDFGDRYFA